MHLANHGSRNVGNAALVLGLEHVLREDLPGEVDFAHEPWDEYSRGLRRFDEAFVGRVNAESDALLVGAAVSFDGSSIYANTGFRFDLPLELWDRIERPIVFYGLSHRAWARKPFHRRDELRRALEHALTANDRVLFSVRNDGTKEWLESVLGRASDRIHVVPDPALYVPAEDSMHPELEPGKLNVLLALNSEDEPYRWGRAARRRTLRRPDRSRPLPFTSSWGWRESRDRFLGGLVGALDRLSREHDLNLVFCAHDPFDLEPSFRVFELLPEPLKQRSAFASAALPNARGPYFYDLYAKADLVLSMRVHSISPAIGLGTPLVPLVSQQRMTAFLDDAGLGDLAVDVSGDGVYEAASRALAEPGELRTRLADARARLRARTAEFDSRVAEFVAA